MKGTVAILFVVICSAFSQLIRQGNCPEVQPVKNFNVSRCLGIWYEASRYFISYQNNTECNKVSYRLKENGNVTFVNESYNVTAGKKQKDRGTGSFATNGLGEFAVYIAKHNLNSNYSILGTDYDNYSSVYSCVEVSPGVHATWAWLLTRSKNPSDKVISAGKKAFEAQNLNTSDFITVNKNCK